MTSNISRIAPKDLENIQCFAGNPPTTGRVSKGWRNASYPALLSKMLQDPFLSTFYPETPSASNGSFKYDPKTNEHLDSGARYEAYKECINNPRLCVEEMFRNKQKDAELRKQRVKEMALGRRLGGKIAVFVGDPIVTERIAKIWNHKEKDDVHRKAIFAAILASWKRDPILLGFFPTPGQSKFVYDYQKHQNRAPHEATEAYVNVCSDPELCVKEMFDALRVSFYKEDIPAFPKREIDTLDRARLTNYCKARTTQEFIEQSAKSLSQWDHPSGTGALIKGGCLKPDSDVAAMESGLKKRALVMHTFIKTIAAKGLSKFGLDSLNPFYFFLPTQFGSLTDLTMLEFIGQGLATLPRSIGKCTKLQVLDLTRCPFVIFPKEIGQCKELREVNLINTNILRLDELDQCPKLEKIELADYQLEERLTLTPRTVALLNRLNIKIPARKEDPLTEKVYELQLPPENMDEIDLEELAGIRPKKVEKQESKVEQSGQPKAKSLLKSFLDAFSRG